MSKLAQIQLPLDIPKVDVLSTKQTRDGKFIIRVESHQDTITCGICGQTIPCNYGRGKLITLRHLSILGQETYVTLLPKRGQCHQCDTKPTTTQVLDWYEQRSPHTKAFDRYLMKQLIGSTIADVSLKEKVGYDAIVGSLMRQTPEEIDWSQIEELGTIGIDEIAYKKGHKGYRAVITCQQKDGTTLILATLPDRKKRRLRRS